MYPRKGRDARRVWQVAMLVLVGASIVTATPGTAAGTTFGANLAQPANNGITCGDGWPNQLYTGFNPFEQRFYNSGNHSCLWTGSGGTQTLEPPSSGTVTAVKVRVGHLS